MSNFNFSYGNEQNLPSNKAEGHLYGCSDTGSVFFDFISSLGTLVRKKVCADKADRLRYTDSNQQEQILTPQEIATKTEMAARVATAQGIGNYGKVMGVDSSGNVSAVDISSLGGALTWGALKGATSESE